VPLHILHIQYWGFEPKDCIPTFPFISPWGVLAYSGGCFANAFTRSQTNGLFIASRSIYVNR
jgi:hypothetical protein